MALDNIMKRELKPVLKGTVVKISLGDPKEDSAQKRYASGLDYADMSMDEATIIEIISNTMEKTCLKKSREYNQFALQKCLAGRQNY